MRHRLASDVGSRLGTRGRAQCLVSTSEAGRRGPAGSGLPPVLALCRFPDVGDSTGQNFPSPGRLEVTRDFVVKR